VVAHAGKQHAYRHAAAVQRMGALRAFVTSGYYRPDRFPDRVASWLPWLDARLRRRHLAELGGSRVVRRWRFELPELAARALLGSGGVADGLVMRRDARFDRWVARRWAGAADVYWGFQGSCLESLRAARRAGAVAVAEFATAHVTAAIEILSEEAERHPEWADSISNFHFPAWYRERLEREPHEADYCVVASEFSRRSLLRVGVGPARVKLLPLGVDVADFAFAPRPPDGPFRILFVGGVGQRKGVKYLLEAYRRVRTPGTELVLAGPLCGSGRGLAPYAGTYQYLGRLDQGEVVREMHRAHVLVLPSAFEGFGLVIPEAMATGMPVVASTHSIGPEVIRDGRDGFVLEPDDVEGLAARLDWLAGHRREACEMGREAAARAQELSWDAHARRLTAIVREIGAARHKAEHPATAQLRPPVPAP
jgi:glycosyltransferase involved in cell wall biosynthesis